MSSWRQRHIFYLFYAKGRTLYLFCFFQVVLPKMTSYQIGPQIWIPRPQFTLRPEKIDFIALNALKKGKVLFLELLM